MLPTNEKAMIHLTNSNILIESTELTGKSELYKSIPQYLYILSDEEIKEGDWFIKLNQMKLMQCKDKTYTFVNEEFLNSNDAKDCKKIIATTDKSLIRYNPVGNSEKRKCCDIHCICEINGKLPQPSQSFIEKYVEEYNKGNIITEVLLKYTVRVPTKMAFADYNPVIDGIVHYILEIKN